MGINANPNCADEAGKLIWENDPNKNWWANRIDDIRGIIQGAVNPLIYKVSKQKIIYNNKLILRT
nr:MafB family polymorphic toxin [Neisseria meningitidis]